MIGFKDWPHWVITLSQQTFLFIALFQIISAQAMQFSHGDFHFTKLVRFIVVLILETRKKPQQRTLAGLRDPHISPQFRASFWLSRFRNFSQYLFISLKFFTTGNPFCHSEGSNKNFLELRTIHELELCFWILRKCQSLFSWNNRPTL